MIQLEFEKEKGQIYEYKVQEEVKANRLKLAKDTQKVIDNYEEIFQIGATVEVSWSTEDLIDTNWVAGKILHRLLDFQNKDQAYFPVLTVSPTIIRFFFALRLWEKGTCRSICFLVKCPQEQAIP